MQATHPAFKPRLVRIQCKLLLKHMGKNPSTYFGDDSLGHWLYRCHMHVSAALRRLFQEAGSDLTPEQWTVMLRLHEQEGINQVQLSERTGKDRHNITRILYQLDRRGYIIKKKDKNDKRAFHIFFSPSGKNLYDKMIPLVLEHRKRLRRGFKAEDLIAVRKNLELIIRNLET